MTIPLQFASLYNGQEVFVCVRVVQEVLVRGHELVKAQSEGSEWSIFLPPTTSSNKVPRARRPQGIRAPRGS